MLKRSVFVWFLFTSLVFFNQKEQSMATGGGSGVNRVAILGELELRRRSQGAPNSTNRLNI